MEIKYIKIGAGMRKMTLDCGTIWEYKVGRSNTVLKAPDGKKVIVHNSRMGIKIDVEDPYYDSGSYTTYEVTPLRVKQYIQNHIINQVDKGYLL